MQLAKHLATKTLWRSPDKAPAEFDLSQLHAQPLLARILFARGHRDGESARAFLDPRRQVPPDASRLPGLGIAIDRIAQALSDRERIGIFGDYDVDGVTSTVVIAQALRSVAGDRAVVTRLPERHEGYGLNRAAVSELAADGVGLLITVDCGTSNRDEVDFAATLDIETIVIDHHQVSDHDVPDAILVNPQCDPDSGLTDLAAVGVAYLVVSALARDGHPVAGHLDNDETRYLDLVALGTVSDVAPLIGPNRVLVRDGLDTMHRSPRAGICALARAAERRCESITATDIAFRLGPRLNAAGRLDSPTLALRLLETTDPAEADRLAARLEQVNRTRRIRTEQIIGEATTAIAKRPGWEGMPFVAVAREGWENGLLGGAASRLAESLRRPVAVFADDDGVLHGSARSVDGVNLIEALAGASSLLTRYGGHRLAAGVTMPGSGFDEFERIVSEAIVATGVEIPAQREIMIDADLRPEELEPASVRVLERLEPCGRGNPVPVLRVKDAGIVRYTTMGGDNRHLKITTTLRNRQIDAVLWSGAWRSRELVGRRTVDLVGRLEINEWNGRERLQMILDDFRAT